MKEEISMRKTVLPVALALLAAALPLRAQPASFGEAIDVRVVNVEAVVTGKDGERVRGLTKDDFRLLVDGREAPIGFFNEVTDGTLVATESQDAAAGAPEEEAVGRRILVFIDDSFGIAPHRNMVLDRIGESLGRLSPQDQVAVAAFDGRKLDLLSGWTADRGRIAEALAAARGRRAHGLIIRARLRDLNRTLGDASAIQGFTPEPVPTTGAGDYGPFGGPDFASFMESSAVVVPLDVSSLLSRVVTASAAAMRAMPVLEGGQGRKVMLILSGGWPLRERVSGRGLLDQTPQWMDAGAGEELFRPLVDTANLLGYTLYPVDMPGLGAGTGADVEDTDFSRPGLISSPWDEATDYALNYLAQETGGKAAVNSARLEALDRMAADTSSYYWLGFTPAWKADDRHHRIELEARRPGLRVRTRTGFTDLSHKTEMALSTEGLLLFGQGAQRIGVEMGKPKRMSFSTVKVPVTLSIPAEALTLVPVAGGFAAEASLSVGALDRWGSRSDLPVQTLKLNFHRQPKPGDIVRYRTAVRMNRGRQQVVFTFRDSLNGEMLWTKLDYKP
jgi:VWFA-related protein